MSLKDITAGEKIAKVLGGRFIEAGEKESLGLEVSFSFEEPTTGSQETLSRVFWLTKDAIKKSMEDLTDVLKFNGDESMDENSVLTNKQAFTDGQVKLVIEMEEHEGKEYPKIKWVNNLGGSGFSQANVQTVKSKLQSVGFKALFMSMSSGKKIPESSTSDNTSSAENASYDPDDIPF